MTHLRCIGCGESYDLNRKYFRCDKCGDLLEVVQDFEKTTFTKFYGVWKYKNLVFPELDSKSIITRGEGNTYLYSSSKISEFAKVNGLYLKHEGENPTGSFKDRGMTVAVSHAKSIGAVKTICASTGNTSASAASYSALAGLKSYVIIPKGKISRSKIVQAIAYGANILQVNSDFDAAMEKLENLINEDKEFYTLNSINPWRIEGQKTIFYEILDSLKAVDFIAVPAGNLGNTSALGKAINDYYELGRIMSKPRIISVQAEGASPFYDLWKNGYNMIHPIKAKTVASAIRIGNPVNWKKALKSIKLTDGIVTKVSDKEIMEAKKIIDSSGIGAEPASSASIAGIKRLREEGIIDKSDKIAAVLTGHILKDIDNVPAEPNFLTLDEIIGNMDEQ